MMSRIGRMPIAVPTGVQIEVADDLVRVRGPKGELARPVPPGIEIRRDDGTLNVTRESDAPRQRALHGLMRSLVANMVTGVSEGFTKRLEIQGVGYRAQPGPNGSVVIQVGFSHPVEFPAPAGIQLAVEAGNRVAVSGADK